MSILPAINYQDLNDSLIKISEEKGPDGSLTIGDVIRVVRQQKGCERGSDMQCMEIFLEACTKPQELSVESAMAIRLIERNWKGEKTELSRKARIVLSKVSARLGVLPPEEQTLKLTATQIEKLPIERQFALFLKSIESPRASIERSVEGGPEEKVPTTLRRILLTTLGNASSERVNLIRLVKDRELTLFQRSFLSVNLGFVFRESGAVTLPLKRSKAC